MKKILVLVIAIFVCGNLFSQGIEFEHGTFHEALAKAKKENKLLFMDCYTSWCGPCKWLSKEIFPKKEVGDFFNKNFVSFKIDMEKGEGIELCRKYQVKSFPTLLFLDSQGNEVHKMVGGKPAEELIAGAKCAIDPNLRIGALREKFENGNREYEFLMTYLTSVRRQYDNVNTALVSKALIENYSLEKFITKDLFYVLEGSKLKYGSKDYQYLLKNRADILAKVDAKEYKGIIYNAIKTHLKEYAQKCESLSDLNEEIEKCKRDEVFSNQKYLEYNLINEYYISHGEFSKWFDIMLAEAEKRNENGKGYNVYGISAIGDKIFNDKRFKASHKTIDRAIKLGHELAKSEDGIIFGNLMLARLYLKKGEKEKALKHFNQFFDTNAKAGGNNTHPSVSNLKKAIDDL